MLGVAGIFDSRVNKPDAVGAAWVEIAALRSTCLVSLGADGRGGLLADGWCPVTCGPVKGN